MVEERPLSDMTPFTVWIDADACPRLLRTLLVRATTKRKVPIIFVANTYINIPDSPMAKVQVVGRGDDVADTYIVEHAHAGDLAVTQDIPLAARLLERKVAVINLHGRAYDDDSIQERLSIRAFMEEARGAGVITGGPPPFGDKEKQAFANCFDRALTKALRQATLKKRYSPH